MDIPSNHDYWLMTGLPNIYLSVSMETTYFWVAFMSGGFLWCSKQAPATSSDGGCYRYPEFSCKSKQSAEFVLRKHQDYIQRTWKKTFPLMPAHTDQGAKTFIFIENTEESECEPCEKSWRRLLCNTWEMARGWEPARTPRQEEKTANKLAIKSKWNLASLLFRALVTVWTCERVGYSFSHEMKSLASDLSFSTSTDLQVRRNLQRRD